MYNTALCIPKKSYLELELYNLENLPITYNAKEMYILSTEQIITIYRKIYKFK